MKNGDNIIKDIGNIFRLEKENKKKKIIILHCN